MSDHSIARAPEPAHEAPALIFLHLPKCGGTTLNRIIEWEYNPLRIFSVDPSFFRWSYQKLRRLPRARLSRIQVFKGHMPFGIHKLLPQPAKYITILRDPIDRAISEYYFALGYWFHPEHRMMKRMTLAEYVRATPYHNVQCKLLAGIDSQYDFLAGDCNVDTLELAKHNLSQYFSLVGLTERFDECLALTKILFGWSVTRYSDFNVTRRRPMRHDVPADVLEVIADRYRFDLALYEFAASLFEQTLVKHCDQVAVQLDAIGQAKTLGLIQSFYYKGISAARKALSRVNSAI